MKFLHDDDDNYVMVYVDCVYCIIAQDVNDKGLLERLRFSFSYCSVRGWSIRSFAESTNTSYLSLPLKRPPHVAHLVSRRYRLVFRVFSTCPKIHLRTFIFPFTCGSQPFTPLLLVLLPLAARFNIYHFYIKAEKLHITVSIHDTCCNLLSVPN